MALLCKKCNKVTRKKKPGSFTRAPRCQGCGSFDFDIILDAMVLMFDFEDLLYFGDEGYDDFDMEVIDEGPVEISEDRFIDDEPIDDESANDSSEESSFSSPEPEIERSSSFGNSDSSSSDYGSSSYDSSSSDYSSSSSDCGGGGDW